jgi:hypothetical protein
VQDLSSIADEILELYRHLGFTAFGPTVGAGESRFQPMYLTLERYLEVEKALAPPAPLVQPR